MLNDCRTLGVYNKKLNKIQVLKEITDKTEKVLMQAICKVCGVVGMAYQDPNERQPRDHYCIKHNRHTQKPNNLEVKIGKEPTCLKPFNNNGRNSHKEKEFCSCHCANKYYKRKHYEENKA